MSRILPALWLAAAFATSACFSVSDGGFRVKGILADQSDTPLERCQLALHLADENREVDSKSVSEMFNETFLVTPKSHRFFLVISCTGAKPYTTPVFEVSGIEQYRNPVDLGTIQLEPE